MIISNHLTKMYKTKLENNLMKTMINFTIIKNSGPPPRLKPARVGYEPNQLALKYALFSEKNTSHRLSHGCYK